VVALLVLAAAAVWQWRQAVEREQVALSRQLAASSVTQLPVDPELSLILALRAGDHAHTDQAERALRLALAESHVRASTPLRPARPLSAEFAPGGRYLLVLARNGVASGIDVQSGRTRLLSGRRTIDDQLGGPTRGRGTAFAPDGSAAAIVNVDGSFTAWQPGSWTRLARWPGRFVDASLPPRARLAVTIDAAEHAEVRSFPAGKVVARLGTARVFEAPMAPDGRAIAVSEEDPIDDQESHVRLWFGPTWRRSVLLRNQVAPAFSANGRWLATSSQFQFRGGVTVWNARTGKAVHTLGPECLCTNGFFTQDGRLLVTTSPDGTEVLVWSTRAWDLVSRIRGDTRETLAALASDGALAVQISESGVPSLTDVLAERRVASLRGHTGAVLAATVRPDRTVLTASSDGTLRSWDAGSWTSELRVPEDATAAVLAGGKITALVSDLVDFAESSLLEARVAPGGRIQDWRRRARLEEGGLTPVFSSDGRYAAFDGAVWALGGRRPHPVRTFDAEVASFSPDGKFLAVGKGDSRLVGVYAAGSWTRTRQLRRASDASSFVPDLAVAPGGTHVLVAPFEAEAAVWRVRDGKRLFDLGNLPTIYAASFSDDGTQLVVGADGEPLRIHDASTGEVLTELLGHSVQAGTAEFSPDGKLVLSTANDGSMRIWDAASGQQITALFAESNSLQGASFDETGATVVTWGEGVVRTYLCAVCGTNDELRERAARRVTRELTASERRVYGE
jgi:WD40 repeat protein